MPTFFNALNENLWRKYDTGTALLAIQQCIGSSRLAAISALERSHGLTSCDWGGTLIANVTFLFPQWFSEQLNICALEVFVKYSVFRFG